ncbi:MAG TPA: UvrB/UvrC motif-containing protein, partial [Lacunisphaera sp.]|nr:UvrB/UvrC motif-containing protein [Lacunisphaera sp.]
GKEADLAVAESSDDVAAGIAELEEEMQEAANKLEFERAALLRDQINSLKAGDSKRGGLQQPAYGRKSRRKGK